MQDCMESWYNKYAIDALWQIPHTELCNVTKVFDEAMSQFHLMRNLKALSLNSASICCDFLCIAYYCSKWMKKNVVAQAFVQGVILISDLSSQLRKNKALGATRWLRSETKPSWFFLQLCSIEEAVAASKNYHRREWPSQWKVRPPWGPKRQMETLGKTGVADHFRPCGVISRVSKHENFHFRPWNVEGV
jgi:hypothetical protein